MKSQSQILSGKQSAKGLSDQMSIDSGLRGAFSNRSNTVIQRKTGEDEDDEEMASLTKSINNLSL